MEQVENITVEKGECITSYCVKALFTSVSVYPTINIIRNRLETDEELHNRTSIFIKQIIILLEFCLKGTYLFFHGMFYEQLQGAAMGSPINTIVVNLLMEDFETKAIKTSTNLPRLWRMYWYDSFAIQKTAHKNQFLELMNSIHSCIYFSTEDTKMAP